MTKLPRKGTHARALYDLQKKYGAKIKSEIRLNGRTRYAVYWMER